MGSPRDREEERRTGRATASARPKNCSTESVIRRQGRGTNRTRGRRMPRRGLGGETLRRILVVIPWIAFTIAITSPGAGLRDRDDGDWSARAA